MFRVLAFFESFGTGEVNGAAARSSSIFSKKSIWKSVESDAASKISQDVSKSFIC